MMISLTVSLDAADYYVATTGSDANPGTEALPWRMIQKAGSTMVAGDMVMIRGGVYEEVLRPQNSGAEGAYITYRSYPGEQAIIRSTDTSGAGFCIVLSSQLDLHYLRFADLTLRGAGGAGFAAGPGPAGPKSHLALDSLNIDSGYLGIYFEYGVTESEIVNCEIHYNQYNIYLRGANSDILIDNNHTSNANRYRSSGTLFSSNIELNSESGAKNRRIVISNNHVHDAFTQGIVVVCADDIIVRNNYSHHNGATGIQIESRADPDITQRVVVEGNLCEYNSQRYPTETGIWIDDSDSVIVQNNVMRYNEHGLRLTGSNHVIVRFNAMYENNHDNFIGASGIFVNTSAQVPSAIGDIIIHNTIYGNGGNSTRAQVNFGVNHEKPPVTQSVFMNNIASNARSPYDHWVYGLSHVIDYNTFYNSARPLEIVWQQFLTTWPGYVAASGLDEHSIVADPVFASPSTGDFELMTTSPCIDGGAFLTTTQTPGSGVEVEVNDTRFFSNGMGLVAGDWIRVGAHDSLRVLTVVDSTNTITVDRAISWNAGDGVGYPYMGLAPDMGAFEYDPTVAGDSNGDGQVTSADIVYLVNYVFKSGLPPIGATGDTDCSGQVNSSDIVVLVNFVFKSGPEPCAP